MDVRLREYKPCALEGGTLLVSVPQIGLGSVLLTDHILEQHHMDQVAAFDSDELPPIAMVRKGRARYPLRVHADARSRIAVMRSEVQVPAYLTRALAISILEWVKARGLARVVALDNVASEPEPGESSSGAGPALFAIGSDDRARAVAREAKLAELDDAVLGGLLGMLVLEARFADVPLVGLVAELRSPLDEARSLLAFADALPRLVPGLALDPDRLQKQSREVAETIRSIQAEIDRAMRTLQPKPPAVDGMPLYE